MKTKHTTSWITRLLSRVSVIRLHYLSQALAWAIMLGIPITAYTQESQADDISTPNYLNLMVEGPWSLGMATSFISGNIGRYPDAPRDGQQTAYLVRSTFGHAVSHQRPLALL